jgi:hypothetical protein
MDKTEFREGRSGYRIRFGHADDVALCENQAFEISRENIRSFTIDATLPVSVSLTQDLGFLHLSSKPNPLRPALNFHHRTSVCFSSR